MKKNKSAIKELALNTFETEAKAVLNLKKQLNDDFVRCVQEIYDSKGRVILTGIGKSAIIASKIVATLNSTGTPAVFMHAADAIHGDIGTIQKDDTIICISKSGDTPEIKILVPLLKSYGNKLAAIVGNTDSYLAQRADYVLNTYVEKEACPNNLAPTSSSVAQMAMGDALAICLLKVRNFSVKDFARFHPGGALGKRLYLKVADLYKHNLVPKVNSDDSLKKVIMEISSKRLGATAVIDKKKLAGIITDGDLRRMLEKTDDISHIQARDIMTPSPKTIEKDTMAVDALLLMKQANITQLMVTHKKSFIGFIHLHDLLKEGIF